MKQVKQQPTVKMEDLDTHIGLKIFAEIMGKWGIKRREALILLGSVAPQTYSGWRNQAHPKLSRDTITRISYIIGIAKGLRIIFGNTERADNWINKPNKNLGGRSALDIMLGGEIVDLAYIRDHVDTARGQ